MVPDPTPTAPNSFAENMAGVGLGLGGLALVGRGIGMLPKEWRGMPPKGKGRFAKPKSVQKTCPDFGKPVRKMRNRKTQGFGLRDNRNMGTNRNMRDNRNIIRGFTDLAVGTALLGGAAAVLD